MSRGIIFCFAGPSGSGKTTLADILVSNSDESRGQVSKVITVTTRAPREGEIDDVHYHFWNQHHFREAVSAGMFFEHEEVHGHLYGTLKESVQQFIDSGNHGVIILDVNGAMKLKDAFPEDAVTIFMTAKSSEELRRRVSARRTSPEDIERRMAAASAELRVYSENVQKFDYLILTESLERAVGSLKNITFHEAVKRGHALSFESL